MDEALEIRQFNRFYTRAIGVLDGGLHDTPWSLPEARIMLELAQRDATGVTALRTAMDIDAGHLSRLLTRLEGQGLVERARDEHDGRRQTVRLTAAGWESFRLLDGRAAAAAGDLLGDLAVEERGELVRALRTVRALLGDDTLQPAGEDTPTEAPRASLIRDAEPGDLGWVVEAHGRLYAREYGWGAGFEALVARVCADHLAQQTTDAGRERERAWIAEVDGRRAGCLLCVGTDDPATAQLRLLLVEPFARGLGLGSQLVERCLRFAERAGYEEIFLWTNHPLVDARRIYERAGFTLAGTEPHADWGVELEGQVWRRPLGTTAPEHEPAGSSGD